MKSRKKYVGKKPSKKPYRRKLIYGVIVVVAVILGFLVYSSSQRPPNKPSNNFPFKAGIIDQLGKETGPTPPFYPNNTFINATKNMLETYGFKVDYHESEDVTVNFYRSLPTRGYGLIIFRVHSAIIQGLDQSVGLFTSEPYGSENPYPYVGLVKAFYNESSSERYFGIAPRFIEVSMDGSFENTIVILMGCNGLTYDTTAEAFVNRGAKVCIGWNGLVSAHHTDRATEYLIQRLVVNRWTVENAVEATNATIGPDLAYESELEYYPPAGGNFAIPFGVSSFSLRIFETAAVLTKEKLRLV